MTTVGFIGSGRIGGTLARLAIQTGHQDMLSNSRGPETLADAVAGSLADSWRQETGTPVWGAPYWTYSRTDQPVAALSSGF